ncbi:cytochrome c [Vibrio amylolyticus]|uniref:c-type cytochrome n=1 Tax=Vibrio amylolyticus TaxID=2847292 RepID=UPI00354C66DB
MNKFAVLVLLVAPLWVFANDYEKQIDDRQAAFSQIEQELDSAKRIINGNKTYWVELKQHSELLQQYGLVLADSFPVGSHTGSKAKEKIWDSLDKFDQLLSQMTMSFDDLEKASQRRDPTMANDAIKRANSTCRNCHRSYRSRW